MVHGQAVLLVARALSKPGSVRSPAIVWLEAAIRFVHARRRLVLAVAAGVAIAGAAVAGYLWHQQRQEQEASRALAQAQAALRGEKADSRGDPDTAMRRYREVTEKFWGTRSAEEALYRLGGLQLSASKVDEAIASFGLYLAGYPRGRFTMMSRLGKAYAQETKGDLQGAVQTLSEGLEREAEDPLAGEAYIALGRMYEGLKKSEDAIRVYGQVVERFGQTQWAQHALQRMGALRTK